MTTSASDRRIFANAVLLTLGYAVVFYVFQFFIYRIGIASRLPDAENLLRWDAAWYRSVGFDGYSYAPTRQTTSGFFWLFPTVWRLLGGDALVMSAVNMVFLALGVGALAVILSPPVRDKLLWVSTPAVFFAFVPYAEALFFCLCSFCLLGISLRRQWLVAVLLFLMALTRATAVFVVPAFLAMEVMAAGRGDFLRSVLRGFAYYVLPSLLGLGVFVLLQYQATGVWFAYFRAQAECWKRIWAVPVLPLYNTGGYMTVWINALALLVCLTALIYTVILFARWFFRSEKQDRVTIVSMAYLGVALFSTLFYSPQWRPGFTDVIGTFRYTMLSPFFFVFLNRFSRVLQYKWHHFVLAVLYASAVWMAFGAYVHIREFLFFSGCTVLVVLYMFNSNPRHEWAAMLLMMLNFFLQVYFYQHFLEGITLVD